MKTKIVSSLIIASSMAMTPSAKAEDDVQLSPEVVVTASRIAQTLEDTLAAVTIITREDIEKKQPRSIMDLFKNVPGLSLKNNGGQGKSTDVYLRGSESDHVLVLIDGVRVGAASSGTTSFQHIPVEQIERIEIVRGPRSHLYGSSAIGGVIQIFTRRGSDALKTFGSVGYGTHNSREANGGFSGSAGETQFALNMGKRRTDGFDSYIKNVSTEPDKDGYSQQNISGRLSHDFDNGLELEIHGSVTESSTQFDGTSRNETDASQRIIGFKATKDITDYWDMSLNTSRNLDLTTNDKDGTFYSSFDTIRDNATLQNSFYINDENTVVAGLDYQLDQVQTSKGAGEYYGDKERLNSAAFGQYIGEYGDHNVQLSLRFDENEQFGDHTTGSVAWGYSFLPNMEVLASYGTAYKAPTLNEIYYPDYGSLTIQPEESKSYEIGLRGREAMGNWAVYAFQTDVKNLIAQTSYPDPVENIASAKIRGVEAEGSLKIDNLNVASNISYVRPENRSAGANYGNMLTRRAKWHGNLNLDYQIDDYTLGADFNYVGNSYDNAGNTRKLKRYNTVDLRGAYALTLDWDIELSANNVFNRDYQNASYYMQDGRNFFLRLRYALD